MRPDDIDRGWAWVVLFSSCVILALLAVFVTGTGIFQVEFLETFQGSQGLVALVCSVAISSQFILGPVAGIVSDLLTHRVAIMTGAALVSVAMVTASFCQDLVSLFFFYGVVVGLGSGLIYTPAVTVVSTYFHQYRTLASGISLAAPGVGILAAPYLIGWLIDAYGWRSAMVYFGCCIAQICVLAALFFPDDTNPTPRCCTKNTRRADSSDEAQQLSLQNGGLEEGGGGRRRKTEMGVMVGSGSVLRMSELGSMMLSQYSISWSTQEVASDNLRHRIKRVLGQKFLWVICLNQVLMTAGFAITIILFPAYAQSVAGLSLRDIAPLYIVYGVSVTVIRILAGFVFSFIPNHLVKALFSVQLAYAVTLCLLPLFSSFSSLLVCKLFIGVTYGPSYSLVAPIVAGRMGLSDLSLAFGVVTLGSGLGSVLAPPLAVGAAVLSLLLLSVIKDSPQSPDSKSHHAMPVSANKQNEEHVSTNQEMPIPANQHDKLLSTNQETPISSNQEFNILLSTNQETPISANQQDELLSTSQEMPISTNQESNTLLSTNQEMPMSANRQSNTLLLTNQETPLSDNQQWDKLLLTNQRGSVKSSLETVKPAVEKPSVIVIHEIDKEESLRELFRDYHG